MTEERNPEDEKRPSNPPLKGPNRFVPIYRPEDDTYCWLCGGPVDKRHCKIICPVCGFMRDCSDP
jgi:hypothetical protein